MSDDLQPQERPGLERAYRIACQELRQHRYGSSNKPENTEAVGLRLMVRRLGVILGQEYQEDLERPE